jgi:hypothetical protein
MRVWVEERDLIFPFLFSLQIKDMHLFRITLFSSLCRRHKHRRHVPEDEVVPHLPGRIYRRPRDLAEIKEDGHDRIAQRRNYVR